MVDTMKPTEYTLSSETSAELEQQLRPFLERKINGIPIAEWLMRPERELTPKDYLPPDIRIAIAAKLENVLATTGGPEGLKLLEALDGIIHGGGKPAIVIHGLPTATDIAPIIREAFRQKMFPDVTRPYQEQLEIKDTPDTRKRSGFDAEGTTYFHVDDANIGLLFGVRGGVNPRHTEIMTVDDCIDQVSAMMKGDWPDATPEYIRTMLMRPIWPIEVAQSSNLGRTAREMTFNKDFDAKRAKEAQALGLTRTGEDGKTYAPIIYTNPNFHADEEGSQPYKILGAPFAQLLARLNHDHTQVTGQDDWMLGALTDTMHSVLKSAPYLRKGPVIKEGDLLVFNNRAIFHSGGGFVHAKLAGELSTDLPARTINTLDVQTNPADQYPVQPADRVAKPIRLGTIGNAHTVSIDPQLFR